MRKEGIWLIVIIVVILIILSGLFGGNPFSFLFSVTSSLLNLVISVLVIVALVLLIIWLYHKTQNNYSKRSRR